MQSTTSKKKKMLNYHGRGCCCHLFYSLLNKTILNLHPKFCDLYSYCVTVRESKFLRESIFVSFCASPTFYLLHLRNSLFFFFPNVFTFLCLLFFIFSYLTLTFFFVCTVTLYIY